MPIGTPQAPETSGSGGGLDTFGMIGSALPVVGSVVNALATSAANKQTREWNEKMYYQQRSDALADWRMQNEYNSPAANMERLKSAGLNPNLVYGSGAQATPAQAPRSSSPGSYTAHAPQINLDNPVSGFMAVSLQKAQLDNLAIQKMLLNEEVKNRAADTLKKLADTDTTKSNRDLIDTKVQQLGLTIGYQPEMLAATLEGKRAGVSLALQRTQESMANTKFKLDENERRALINGVSYEAAATKILQMRQQMNLASIKSAYDRQLASSRNTQIQATIENIQAQTKANDERARLLKSTPDWSDQRAIDALQKLLGGMTAPGTKFNPKMYRGWTQ